MYIEDKSNGLSGPGRIGRVRFSQTGKSIYYGGRTFQTLAGRGFKANYFDVETGGRNSESPAARSEAVIASMVASLRLMKMCARSTG